MALSIRNPETDRLVRELARETGEDMTDAVTIAVRERLERVRSKRKGLGAELLRIANAMPPVLDPRPLDELVTDEDWGIAE